MAVVQSHGRVRLVQAFMASVTARHEFRANSWLATLRLGSWSYDDDALRLRPAATTGDRRRTNDDHLDLDTEHYMTGDHWTLTGHSGHHHGALDTHQTLGTSPWRTGHPRHHPGSLDTHRTLGTSPRRTGHSRHHPGSLDTRRTL